MGTKTLPTIWGTYMTLVTKYQISAINSCWEKCVFNGYAILWEALLDPSDSYFLFADFVDFYTHLTHICICTQAGSRNLTDPKTLLTIWYTYMTLVTKYQISVINSYWEKWTYMHIFRHIFLSNYWWQKSDIWSQASYRYTILWEAFQIQLLFIALFDDFNLIIIIFHCLCPSFYLYLSNRWR
jgi:hypothetical protein